MMRILILFLAISVTTNNQLFNRQQTKLPSPRSEQQRRLQKPLPASRDIKSSDQDGNAAESRKTTPQILDVQMIEQTRNCPTDEPLIVLLDLSESTETSLEYALANGRDLAPSNVPLLLYLPIAHLATPYRVKILDTDEDGAGIRIEVRLQLYEGVLGGNQYRCSFLQMRLAPQPEGVLRIHLVKIVMGINGLVHPPEILYRETKAQPIEITIRAL